MNRKQRNGKMHGRSSRWSGLERLEERALMTAINIAATTTFPLLTNDSTPAIAGTVDDVNATLTVTLTHTGGAAVGTFPATNTGGNWTFTVPNPNALADGVYDVTVDATDNGGADTGQLALPASLTIDTTAPAVIPESTVTANPSPQLEGTINDTNAFVVVTINGSNYAADNLGNGSWRLVANTIAALPDGTFTFSVKAFDQANNQSIFNGALLVVDSATPIVTVDKLLTANTSPALTGTINDGGATISVNVAGADYAAVNNGDGTWTLAASTITALTQGTYTVIATATNALGTAGVDTTTNELTVGVAQNITMGAGISKITYTDADGTLVTVQAGKGTTVLTLTGVDVVATGTGSSRTITATGGVKSVDVDVQLATASLSFTTNASGDGQTSIHNIIGAGSLTSLTGKALTITGTINMTGNIQKITVHEIDGNVTMGTFAKGVSIIADTILNSTITTSNIATLTAKLRFENSNVTSTTVGNVSLTNAKLDNGGVAFGITSTTTKSLKLIQAGTTLTWKKSFNSPLLDFFIIG